MSRHHIQLRVLVQLKSDLYNVDLAGRAKAFKDMVVAGTDVKEALAVTGLLTYE